MTIFYENFPKEVWDCLLVGVTWGVQVNVSNGTMAPTMVEKKSINLCWNHHKIFQPKKEFVFVLFFLVVVVVLLVSFSLFPFWIAIYNGYRVSSSYFCCTYVLNCGSFTRKVSEKRQKKHKKYADWEMSCAMLLKMQL